LYDQLLLRLYPDDLSSTFVKRAAVLCPELRVSDALFLELRPLLLGFPVAISQQVLRSWLNSWTTSRRMKVDSVCRCMFSCDAPDGLGHYLRCPRLWEAIHACDRLPVPECVGARLSFRPFSKFAIFRLVVASDAYRSLRIILMCRGVRLILLRYFSAILCLSLVRISREIFSK